MAGIEIPVSITVDHKKAIPPRDLLAWAGVVGLLVLGFVLRAVALMEIWDWTARQIGHGIPVIDARAALGLWLFVSACQWFMYSPGHLFDNATTRDIAISQVARPLWVIGIYLFIAIIYS